MKKSLRIVGALAAGLLTAAGAGVATAHAADVIDPAHDVSLTINKYVGEPGDTSTPLANVQFKLEKINVDLTTDAGWKSLSDNLGVLTDGVADNENGLLLATPSFPNLDTGATGTATISTATNTDFKVGAYLVTEVQSGAYSVAKPFVVTLPWADANTGAWNYTQTVNPKNQSVKPTKQVVSGQAKDGSVQNATIGSNLHYTVDAPVPAGTLNSFAIDDVLDPSLTLVNPLTSLVAWDSTAKAAVGGVTLAAGTDYTATYVNNTLHVAFTPAGLTALQNARKATPGLAVRVTFDATLASIPASGTVPNTATVTSNGATYNTNVDVAGTPASSTFASVTITKTSPTGVNDELNGAVFELYQCHLDSTVTPAKYVLDAPTKPISVATSPTGQAATTLTTVNGAGATPATATGFGVPVQDFSTDTTGAVTYTYCAVETKAPANYLRNPEVIPLNYDAAKKTLSASVSNQKDTLLGQLPATGAWGLLLALLVGGGLVARGVITSRSEARA